MEILEEIRQGLDRLVDKGAHGMLVRPQDPTFYFCSEDCRAPHQVTPIMAIRVPCDYCEQHWVLQSTESSVAVPTREDVMGVMMECVNFYVEVGVTALITGEITTLVTPEVMEAFKPQLWEHCPKRRGEDMILGVPFPAVGAFVGRGD